MPDVKVQTPSGEIECRAIELDKSMAMAQSLLREIGATIGEPMSGAEICMNAGTIMGLLAGIICHHDGVEPELPVSSMAQVALQVASKVEVTIAN